MGTFSLKGQVFILTCCALMLMSSAAERQISLQSNLSTWDEARSHCQKCFKDLVTLTPENNQIIAQKLGREHWVGLRKSFNSSTSDTAGNSNMTWSRWANGDPLAFQNWYPGWPVFKSPFPRRDCCSCSCTCPNEDPTSTTRYTNFTSQNTSDSGLDVTDFTALLYNFTNVTTAAPMTTTLPVEATCARTPMVMPDVPDPDENYIEDSCVAMLSFGAWIEKNCSERLPFICYDDPFFGKVTVTNKSGYNASLKWRRGPDGTTHYRVEVKGPTNVTGNETDLTHEVNNLTPGTHYTVQVFPVKCNRDLDPQEAQFYTTPLKVENLRAISKTDTSISLNWTKPFGNVDSYLIKVQGAQTFNLTPKMTSKEVSGLVPGNLYNFTVFSVVNNSEKSEASNISEYTKPGKVSNLTVSDNTNQSLVLMWKLPVGNASQFRVTALNSNDRTLNETTVDEMKVTVPDLPSGSEITLVVAALVNHTLEGDNMTTVGYTVPGPISDLKLSSTASSIHARWKPPEGNYSRYVIELNGTVVANETLRETTKNITGLNNSACYNLIIYCTSGPLKGPEKEKRQCTLPEPVLDVSATDVGKNHITLTWKPPLNSSQATYRVEISSTFWGWTESVEEHNTFHRFSNLTSGTKYNFKVRTVVDEKMSEPKSLSKSTVAEKRTVGLSMMCTSTESLLCEGNATRQTIFKQLKERFKKELQDNIFWNFEDPFQS